MNFDLIYVDLDCTTPFIVRIRTDNQADAINTRISRGNITFDAFEILSLLFMIKVVINSHSDFPS